ncbi:MAG: hypothetical protein ACR2GU_14315 [Rubrobacteraceae bacterium]
MAGSIGGRVSRLETESRDRALREVVEHIGGLSNREIAFMFANPQSPPASADRERQEHLLKLAGADERKRMEEVVKALLESLGGRKSSIRKLMRGGD